MGMSPFDVVVVGAGPGGSVLAYRLAQRGVRVALVEKESLPRYKTCGGGVTAKVGKLLDFDFSAAVETDVAMAVLSYNGAQEAYIHPKRPLGWMVMRSEFDACLAQQAVKAGAILLEGTAVTAVEPGGVRTRDGLLPARVIAGADGMPSRVGKAVGLRPATATFGALEAEVELAPEVQERYQHAAVFDFGAMPGGYAWIFPKRAHLSIGLCSAWPKPRGVQRRLDRFIGHYAAGKPVRTIKRLGHLIPTGGERGTLHKDNVLLVGDAAGLVDPFSGEGIYYAIRSGMLAVEPILAYLAGQSDSLADYTRAVRAEFLGDFRTALKLQRLLYRRAQLAHRLLFRNAHFGHRFVDVLAGEVGYHDFVWTTVRQVPQIAQGFFRAG